MAFVVEVGLVEIRTKFSDRFGVFDKVVRNCFIQSFFKSVNVNNIYLFYTYHYFFKNNFLDTFLILSLLKIVCIDYKDPFIIFFINCGFFLLERLSLEDRTIG